MKNFPQGKLIGIFITGLVIGWMSFRFMYPTLAPTSPAMTLGENTGRIIVFDVPGWPTPNFLFQKEGRLPVVLYPTMTNTNLTVHLRDGRTLSYQQFVEEFKSQSENYSHALFVVDYRENNAEELGSVTRLQQTR